MLHFEHLMAKSWKLKSEAHDDARNGIADKRYIGYVAEGQGPAT